MSHNGCEALKATFKPFGGCHFCEEGASQQPQGRRIPAALRRPIPRSFAQECDSFLTGCWGGPSGAQPTAAFSIAGSVIRLSSSTSSQGKPFLAPCGGSHPHCPETTSQESGYVQVGNSEGPSASNYTVIPRRSCVGDYD